MNLLGISDSPALGHRPERFKRRLLGWNHVLVHYATGGYIETCWKKIPEKPVEKIPEKPVEKIPEKPVEGGPRSGVANYEFLLILSLKYTVGIYEL